MFFSMAIVDSCIVSIEGRPRGSPSLIRQMCFEMKQAEAYQGRARSAGRSQRRRDGRNRRTESRKTVVVVTDSLVLIERGIDTDGGAREAELQEDLLTHEVLIRLAGELAR